ncbi:molybdate transport system substrate-binding protein [Thermomonospora echinospora]|uniref:Molybdate transport system substrate-binding protein n=1 Tax=Thermomonospora echinospora TaxID=1992 RepID=A0A1H6BLS4_9ACTN|nr:molybdate ABC transporter substrate-binding protein [Thermomonospora echinospora]SEG61623.1 molybdate transport system substrate-binding protein [Thermomonospora echinospora]
MPLRPLLRRLAACAGVLLLAPAVAGCGESSAPVTLTVFAPPSLTEVFTELGAVYGRSHGVKVRLVFGGSPELVERLRERQRADVLVTGDETAMQTAAKYVGARRIVARNSMTIAVAPGNPREIHGVTDLIRPGLRVVLGSSTTPVGRYARQITAKEGLTVRASSEEISARAVLTRVRTGEADAGIVYITDMRSAGAAASSVPIPADQNVTVAYPAAPVLNSDHPEAARTLFTWLTSAQARPVLHRHGFVPP